MNHIPRAQRKSRERRKVLDMSEKRNFTRIWEELKTEGLAF